MLSIYFIFTLLVFRASAIPLRTWETILKDQPILLKDEDTTVANINDFLDKVQPRISQFLIENNLDPLKIEDMGCDFWVIPPIIPYIQHKGTVALTSGTLNSISTVERKGNAVATYKNKRLQLDVVFGFDSIYASYDFYAKVLLLHHYGNLDAIANSLHVQVKLDVDLENYKIVLEKLSLSKVDSITFAFRGSAWVRWLVTPIANAVMPLFKNTVIKSIEGKVAAEIEKSITKINDKFHPIIV